MGALQRLKMATTHLQYIGLLAKLDIPFPPIFTNFMTFPELINFDFNIFFEWFNLGAIDFRLMFVIVAIGIPLGLMLLTALVFFKLHVIQRIACALIGIIMIVLHFFNRALDFIPGRIGDEIYANEFLYLGISFVVGPLLYFVSKKLRGKCKDIFENLSYITPMQCVVGGATGANVSFIFFKSMIVLTGLYLCVSYWNAYWIRKKAFRVIACAMAVGLTVYVTGWVQWSVPVPVELQLPMGIIMVLGILHIVDVFLNMGSSNGVGRCITSVQQTIQRLLDTGLLALALFGLAAAFVPVVTLCVDLFICSKFSCPLNTKFNPRAPQPKDSFTTNSDLFCDPCDFQTPCPLEVERMCPAWSDMRLLKHPEVPCATKGYSFFFIAAVIVLVVFCIIIMMLYRAVIMLCTVRLFCMMKGPVGAGGGPLLLAPGSPMHHGVPNLGTNTDTAFLLGPADIETPPSGAAAVNIKPPTYDPNDEWQEVMEKAEPKAASLFQAYKFKFRYFIIFETFHKLLIVLSNVAIAPFTKFATVVNLFAHVVMTGILFWKAPLLDPLEQKLSVVLFVCSTFTAAYSVAVWQAPHIFGHLVFGILMIIVNIAVPLVVGIALFVVQMRNSFGKKEYQKKAEAEAKKRKEAERKARRERVGLDGALLNDSDVEDMEMLESGQNAKTHEEKVAEKKKREEESKKKKKEETPEELAAKELNRQTKSVILNYFVYASVPLLLAALALTLFATFTAEAEEFVDGSLFFDRSRDITINGYNNFDEFQFHCCCMETMHPPALMNLTERWVCAGDTIGVRGQRTIDHDRRTVSMKSDGIPIRPLCGTSFSPMCNFTVEQNVSVEIGCNETWMTENNITEQAIHTLW